jgi:ribosomal protein S12
LAHSPNTINAAKVQLIEKIEILTFYPGYDGMVKKRSHATVSLKEQDYEIELKII